jgi:hypothetical protein
MQGAGRPGEAERDDRRVKETPLVWAGLHYERANYRARQNAPASEADSFRRLKPSV